MNIFGVMKLLLIGDVPGAVPAALGGTTRTAASPQEAADLLTVTRPDVLLVWSGGWGAAWTAQLPPEKRPPVRHIAAARKLGSVEQRRALDAVAVARKKRPR